MNCKNLNESERHPIQKTLLMVFAGFLIVSGCKDKITDTGEIIRPEPGGRNYVWEVDTLNMPMNLIHSVWGASPDDVWAVGMGGTMVDRLLHYNGEEWTTYTKEIIWCAGATLFGFSADDVWMGGQAGWLAHGAGIWHFDGVEWTENYVYDIEGSYDVQVDDIWGTGPNDVYASGVISFFDGEMDVWRGFVLHYDGKSWKEMARANFNSQFLTIRKEKDDIYLFSYAIYYEAPSVMEGANLEFYRLKGNTFEKIYSVKESQMPWISLYSVDGKVYFVIAYDVYRYVYGKFIKLFSIQNENFGFQICGRNTCDLFFFMKDGLAHFNGSDVEYLYNFPRSSIMLTNYVLLDEDVFFCGFTRPNLYNMVLHGTLQE